MFDLPVFSPNQSGDGRDQLRSRDFSSSFQTGPGWRRSRRDDYGRMSALTPQLSGSAFSGN